MSIFEFVENIQHLSLSPAQRTLLNAFYGEPLTTEETEIFRQCVERDYEPREYSEMTCIAGARSGKDSRIATSIALYEAFCRDHSYLHPGEKGYVLVVAQDQRAGQICFGYIQAAIEQSDLLSAHVQEILKTEIRLDNQIVIAVYPCSYRAPRGVTIICGVADELSFWRDENSRNPDREILRSMARGMANVPSGKLVKISTPFARSGVLYEDFVKRHELTDTLVWKASTSLMNPSISQAFLDRERRKDPVAFAREYGAEFTDDVGGFVPRVAVEACVVPGRLELKPDRRLTYHAFCDAAGGSGADSMTLAIAHERQSAAGQRKYVLDAIREVTPPFSPDSVVQEFARLLRTYEISIICGDRYAGDWVSERFERHGIDYTPSEWTRSELFLEFLPLLNSGDLELLDNPRLVTQFLGLDRRPGSSRRDVIDHRPGEHDDVANAAAGALVAAAQMGAGVITIF